MPGSITSRSPRCVPASGSARNCTARWSGPSAISAPRGASFAEFRDYWEADERFHRLIAENAGNQFILSAYESLGGQIQRFRFFGGLGVTDADFAIEEHSAILEAFAAADPERARDAMVSHLEGVKARAIDDVAHQA
jgi:DNA-binding FadR family transcriptional regulator